MTIGIYKLTFGNSIYIGQSINIEHRFTQHKASFYNEKCSAKIFKAFKQHGIPKLEVLQECKDLDLNICEQYWISLYNSVLKGLNTRSNATSGVTTLVGELNGNSKYSNDLIELVFKYLITDKSHEEVCQLLNVNIQLVKRISSKKNHKWLQDKFPEEYKYLLNRNGKSVTRTSAKEQGIIYPSIKSPEGIEYKVDSVRGFAKLHNLEPSGLCNLLNKKQKSHRKWVLA